MKTPQDMLSLYALEETLREIEEHNNLFYGGLCSQALWNLILMLTGCMNDFGQGF